MPIRPITKGAAIKEDLLEEEEYEDVVDEDEDDDEEYEDEDDDMDDEEYDELDDEEYEDDDEYEERSRLIPYAIMAAALVAFVSLGYYAYNSGTETVSDGELMLIQAEQTPVKEKPLDPGGMQFPYQDKSVFETITSDAEVDQKAEVVSTIEEPMVIEPTTSSIVSSDVAPPAEVLATTAPETANAVEPVAVEEKPVAMVKEVAPVEAVAEPAPKPVETVASKGSDTIQLGAYRTSEDAQAAWKKISGQHSVLSGYTPSVVRADLGEKGVFYRLRVPGVDGQNVCGALKTAGQPCIKAN